MGCDIIVIDVHVGFQEKLCFDEWDAIYLLFMFLFSFLFLFLSNSMSKIMFQILLGTIWVTREFRGLVGSWIYLPIERIALLPLEFGLVGLIDWRTVYYPRRSLKKKALYINKKKELQKVFLKKAWVFDLWMQIWGN